MPEPVNPKSSTGATYVLDAESELELSRLLMQDHLLTTAMGGVWPEQADISMIQYVLDVACGPGGWVLDVAAAYPDKEVMGIDITPAMIRYAKAQSRAHHLDNADFAVMDCCKPIDIPDESFDLINARYLTSVLPRDRWPAFIQESWRMLRPGGVLRLTEPALLITNSTACDTLNHMITLAMHRAGYGFFQQGYQLRTMELEPRLREAGFQQIDIRTSVLNASGGTKNHEVNAANLAIVYDQVQPLLLKMGVIASSEEFIPLYEQACSDLYGEGFHSIQVHLTAWGRKPPRMK